MAPRVRKSYYSVVRGRTNGIFTDWSKCELSIHKFPNAVYKGFQTLEQAIHFMLAGEDYSSCKDIPVHDLDRVITVSALGHQCTTGCSEPARVDSDSEEEDAEVKINIKAQKHEENETVINQGPEYETDSVASNTSDDNTELKTVLPSERSMSICTYCHESTSETYNVIQCSDCKVWCHYKCTKLPLYQIYMYDLTNRKYTCEQCVEVPEDVKDEYLDLFQGPVQTTSVGVNTEVSTKEEGINTEAFVMRDKGINTEKKSTKEVSIGAGLQQESKLHDGNCQCDKLESEFVKLVDRISDTQGQRKMQNQTNSQSKHNSTNEKELKQKLEATEKKLKEVLNRAEKAEKVSQDLQVKLNSTFIENEIQQSKLKGEIEILNNKLKTERTISSTLRSDFENIESRYKNKNDIILDYDKKIKSQVMEINDLHDEMLSLKLHMCRADDQLIKSDSGSSTKNATVIEVTPEKTVNTHSVAKKRLDGPLYTTPDATNKHSTPITKVKSTQKTTDDSSFILNDSDTNKTGCPKSLEIGGGQDQRRKQILLIGTSNTRYLDARFMAGHKSYVKKIIKYTVEEAKTFVDNYDLDFSPDLIVYQLGCNDISGEMVESHDFSEQMEVLVSTTNLKFPGVKVMISLGLPRRERTANLEVLEHSNKLMTKYNRSESVLFCDNSKLFYKGKPARGVMRDDKHLSKKGSAMLAQNLKQAFQKFILQQQ